MSKIKICGLFRDEDILSVNEFLPDYVGFVFAPSSRQVTFAKAERLRKYLDPRIQSVGVFVNEQIQEITALFQKNVIQIIQLHGQEDQAYIDELQSSCGAPIIKAVRVQTHNVVKEAQRIRADFLLYDQGTGGTGKSFDWDLLGNTNRPYFLAGGVNLTNVERALALQPYCVDVSSGVETSRIKDREKIKMMIQKVRAYDDEQRGSNIDESSKEVKGSNMNG